MNIVFDEKVTMHDCLIYAKRHIEKQIAINSSGVKDINNNAKLLNRITEYAVLIYVNSNHYKQFTISTIDEMYHYGKPINTVIKTGLCLGEISSSLHAKYLMLARQLIKHFVLKTE